MAGLGLLHQVGRLPLNVMLLKTQPCPSCQQPHGFSAWKAANSSVANPLRCKQCAQFFHQKGQLAWFWFVILFPSGLFFAWHWAAGLAALLIGSAAFQCYLTRKYPLVPGPRYG